MFIYPFKPQYHYTDSPYWSPYISLSTNRENLFKYQDKSSLVIFAKFSWPTCIIIHWYYEEKLDGDHYGYQQTTGKHHKHTGAAIHHEEGVVLKLNASCLLHATKTRALPDPTSHLVG